MALEEVTYAILERLVANGMDLALQAILFCLKKADISGLSFREPLCYNTEGTWVSLRPGTWRRTTAGWHPITH